MAVPPPKKVIYSRKREIIRYLILRTVGNFLILLTIFGAVATFGPAAYYEVQFQAGKYFGVRYSVASTQQADNSSELGRLIDEMEEENPNAGRNILSSILAGEKEKILIPDSADFSIVIPKIGANQHVIPNVDPDNEDEYLRALMRGVAHAKGTAFPGMKGTTYLFSHSADNFWNVGRYNAVFYLLNKMEKGDEVAIFFNGVRYNYYVTETKIVGDRETDFIKANIGQGEKLILQTCWPPGTAWKRLLVIAQPKV